MTSNIQHFEFQANKPKSKEPKEVEEPDSDTQSEMSNNSPAHHANKVHVEFSETEIISDSEIAKVIKFLFVFFVNLS